MTRRPPFLASSHTIINNKNKNTATKGKSDECLTSAYNTTSTLTMATSMATSTAPIAKESMSPSTAIAYSEASKETNTHAGSASKRLTSPRTWKGKCGANASRSIHHKQRYNFVRVRP